MSCPVQTPGRPWALREGGLWPNLLGPGVSTIATAPTCSFHVAAPPRRSAAAELAAPPVTSSKVARMPTDGHAGAARAAVLGRRRAAATPERRGSSTMEAVERSTATASTATAPPRSSLTSCPDDPTRTREHPAHHSTAPGGLRFEPAIGPPRASRGRRPAWWRP